MYDVFKPPRFSLLAKLHKIAIGALSRALDNKNLDQNALFKTKKNGKKYKTKQITKNGEKNYANTHS